MSEFTATEEDGNLHFMSDFEEFGDFAELDLHVMLADFEAEAHLLYIERFSSPLVFLLLLGALIVKLAPVDDLCDRWVCLRRNFD